MALIGEIITKIKVDASQQKRELTKAKKALMGFSKVAKKALTGLKIGAVAGAAAFAGIVVMVNKTADEIDLLAKKSSKLGITVAALQKLEFQAKLSGVSTQTMGTALQRMVRRVAEAAQGTGVAVKALDELGLSAKQLNELSPDKQFQLIAKAMQNIGNQSDKVKLAMQLFDTEGVALVNTMNSNLEATGKQFDKLGLSITKSQAAAVEAFNDSKTVLGEILGGFAQQLTVKLAPAFQFLIDKISQLVIDFGGMGVVGTKVADMILSTMSGIAGGVGTVLNGIDGMILGFEKAILVINKLQAASAAFWAPFLSESFIEKQFGQVVKGETEILSFQERIAARNKVTGSIQSGITGARGAVNTAAAPPTQAQIELLIKTDPHAAIEILKKDKVVDAIVQQIIREETAKIGR